MTIRDAVQNAIQELNRPTMTEQERCKRVRRLLFELVEHMNDLVEQNSVMTEFSLPFEEAHFTLHLRFTKRVEIKVDE